MYSNWCVHWDPQKKRTPRPCHSSAAPFFAPLGRAECVFMGASWKPHAQSHPPGLDTQLAYTHRNTEPCHTHITPFPQHDTMLVSATTKMEAFCYSPSAAAAWQPISCLRLCCWVGKFSQVTSFFFSLSQLAAASHWVVIYYEFFTPKES